MEDESRSPAQVRATGAGSTRETSGLNSSGDNGEASKITGVDAQSLQHPQQINTSTGNTLLNMSNVISALPEYTYGRIQQQVYQPTYPHPAQNSPTLFSYQGSQYPGSMQANYQMPFAAQMPPQNFQQQRPYPHYPINQSVATSQPMFHGQPFFPQQQHIPPPAPGSYSPSPQLQTFGRAPAPVYGMRAHEQYQNPQIRVDNFGSGYVGIQAYPQSEPQGLRRTSSTSSLKVASALRGPPRKPKQSGHALWVGNLPPGTNIIDLKDHFSRDATDDIESVFLISKSNCAFVNYKSEQSCTAAMGRFHDSRFNGVRLVCRLRRGSSPTSATAPVTVGTGSVVDTKNEISPESIQRPMQKDSNTEEAQDTETQIKVKERYFIIKSLTIEDLERSVHSGIWATQSHNEEALNKAYQTAENVYLVFSANKSGEYFGYARMDSAIDDELAATIDSSSLEPQTPQQPSASSATELPLTIPTAATATAPRGYIIDDSARGTIFWEAEFVPALHDTIGADPSPVNTDSGDVSGEETVEPLKSGTTTNSSSTSATFGKPFRITWLSVDRLPFYRTRGLRNPWNTNREVKIARDGTELEPSVGRKLVGMFNSHVIGGRPQQQSQHMGMMPQPANRGAYRQY